MEKFRRGKFGRENFMTGKCGKEIVKNANSVEVNLGGVNSSGSSGGGFWEMGQSPSMHLSTTRRSGSA